SSQLCVMDAEMIPGAIESYGRAEELGQLFQGQFPRPTDPPGNAFHVAVDFGNKGYAAYATQLELRGVVPVSNGDKLADYIEATLGVLFHLGRQARGRDDALYWLRCVEQDLEGPTTGETDLLQESIPEAPPLPPPPGVRPLLREALPERKGTAQSASSDWP